MPTLNFRRIATRTGGEPNVNTLHHLNAIADQLGEITLANRLSGHGLTLNSTHEGQEVLALVQALARAERRLLEKLLEVGQGIQNENLDLAPRALPRQPAPQQIGRAPQNQRVALPPARPGKPAAKQDLISSFKGKFLGGR